MLKQRIITAVLLLPLVACLLFLPNLMIFSAILVPVFGILAWEWSKLIQAGSVLRAVFIIMVLAAIGSLGYQLYSNQFFELAEIPQQWHQLYPFKLLLVALMIWVVAAVLVIVYPKGGRVLFRGPWLRALLGIAILAAAWLAIVLIRSFDIAQNYYTGSWMLLLMLFIIWGADVGAYFAGKNFGKRKLAPVVSPNKTWEGAIGGLILAVILGIVVSVALGLHFKWTQLVTFVVLMVILSVIGDLFESMLKRKAEIKDSSNILPGHGGLLDRLDSTLSVAPFYVAGVLWLKLLG
ncbi:phosphatidate cytidylyltransferase [Kangiella sediminilitoris]|uniref:Phosphatidate cytidylyltransferase n=1 Tax=Kangiella sediminilitoris TaxID=1144748 RepID=A0A1B3BC23_9GAMM|nr:phosphatidate cytidylyltransferase [Kangiella sediminilitoris]AOE50359.1 Phosphatidate cytidylyltransferase [Kangiella sediminilitoris]